MTLGEGSPWRGGDIQPFVIATEKPRDHAEMTRPGAYVQNSFASMLVELEPSSDCELALSPKGEIEVFEFGRKKIGGAYEIDVFRHQMAALNRGIIVVRKCTSDEFEEFQQLPASCSVQICGVALYHAAQGQENAGQMTRKRRYFAQRLRDGRIAFQTA